MSFTIATGKEGNTPKKPLFLVTIVAPDGDTTYLTTSAYYGAPNIVYGGQTWLARILGNDIEAIAAMGPQGYDTVPGFTLSLADGDTTLWNNHCLAHGWRGSAITLTVILWDVPTNTYSTDAIQWAFIGGNPQFSAKDGKLSVDTTSSCNFTRLKVPSVPIQFRCPWAFPPDAASRASALNDPTSQYYQCGYSVDQAGGVGNYASGSTPFTVCDYTRSGGPGGDPSVGCMARMGNGATTSVAPDGDLLHDKAGHYTGRFGGITWIAPTGYSGKSYTGQGQVFGFNAPNTAIVGSYFNWVYGTQWVNVTVLAPASDPNSTRAECIVCFAPQGAANILKLLVNGVEVPFSNSDQLFTWRYISAGGRNGALEGDDIFDNHSDPHGSMCAIEFVVPIQLAGGGSAPSVQALVTGGPILSINSSLAFVYDPPGLVDNSVDPTNNISGPAANPVFAYLDLMSWGNVPIGQIDAISFYAAAQLMAAMINYVGADGNTYTHPAFKASFQLAGTAQQTLARVLNGLRNAANLMVAPNSVTGLIQCFVKQTLADQQPAAITGSNDATARASIHADSTSGTGYYAYLFNESNIETASFRITSPKINAIPNTVAFPFQDEYNGYQTDSLQEIDPASYAYSGNQEINVPIEMLGIPNFDQGTRQGNVLLAEALYGNSRDDAGGTLYFEFTVNHRVLHLASRLGFICGLTWQTLGIGVSAPQPVRILSVKPDTDGEHWQVKAAWHSDEWYTTAYGQNPTPYQNNPLLGAPQRPPYPWSSGWNPNPVGTDALFPYKTSFELDLDTSSYPANITLSGMIPVTLQPAYMPPITPPQLATANTGGTIKPGTYYISLSVDSIIGPISNPAVLVVPAGTNTNTGTLSNIQWKSGASPTWTVYSGTSSINMQAFKLDATSYVVNSTDLNGNPTSITFTHLGRSGGAPPPDVAFNGFQIIQTAVRQGGDWGDTIQTVAGGTVLTVTSGHTVNQWAGYTISLLYRPGVTTQPGLSMVVTSNTSSTLTMPGTGFLAGDVIVCRFKPSTFTASTIGDANAVNVLAPSGLGDFSGCQIMIIDGTGVGYPPKNVLSNTSTVLTINGTFDVTPDATTVFILIDPSPTTSFATPSMSNDGSLNVVPIGTVQASSTVESYTLIQAAAIDADGNHADLQYQPFRELYVPPQSANAAPAVASRTITAPTTVAGTDDILETDSTAAGWTQPIPLASARTSLVTFKKISTDANVITVSATGSDLIDGAATYALSVVNDFVTLAPVTGGYRVVSRGTTGAAPSAVYLTIDPRSAGAYADGVHDDSVPISASIAAGGLFLQTGLVFAFTWTGIMSALAAALSGSSNKFVIYGGGTLLLLSGATSALTLSGSLPVVLRDVVIDGNSQCGANPTIALTSTAKVLLDGVSVLNTTGGQLVLSPGATVYNARDCQGIADNSGN